MINKLSEMNVAIEKDPIQTETIENNKKNYINEYVKEDLINTFISNITYNFLQSTFDDIIKQIQYNNRSTDNKFNITEHDNQIIIDTIYRINKYLIK